MTRSMYDFLIEKNCGMSKEAAADVAGRGFQAAKKIMKPVVEQYKNSRALAKVSPGRKILNAIKNIPGDIKDFDQDLVASIARAGRDRQMMPSNVGKSAFRDWLDYKMMKHPRAIANAAYAGAGLGAAGLGAGLGAGGYAAYKGLAGNEEEAAIVDQALADPEVAQAVQEDPSILDQIVSFAKDNVGAVAGGLGGAGLGALTAAAMSKDNKLRNAAIAGILSGAVGAMGGAAYDRYGRK